MPPPTTTDISGTNVGFTGSKSVGVSSTIATLPARDEKGTKTNNFIDTIKNYIGNSLTVTPVTSFNLDTREGYAHSTTPLYYNFNGEADIIRKKVGLRLTGFQNPIKAILGTQVHTKHKIIITRKYIRGGSAQITPERAPARTVAIQEDAREITMTRYGGDIEMNLNLFLRPDAAKEELDMKMEAQRQMLEDKLVEIGYDTIMSEATNIVDGIMRSNPAYSTMAAAGSQNVDIRAHAERIYTRQIFGALAKHSYAVPNLLASCKYASAYTIGTLKNPVIILPHGTPDLLRYTRPEALSYSVTGVQARNGDKVKMELENAFLDPISGARIMIHHPTPSYEYGAARPIVSAGGITNETTVVMYYDITHVTNPHYMDFKTGAFRPFRDGGAGTFVDFTSKEAAAAGEVQISDLTDVIDGLNDSIADKENEINNLTVAETTAQDNFDNDTDADKTGTKGTLDVAKDAVTAAKQQLAEFQTKLGSKTQEKAELEEALSNFKAANPAAPATPATGSIVGSAKKTKEVYAREVTFMMSSAIVGAPNGEAGSLLVGYPMTGVSTSQATETMRIQLRTYLGCALTNPESVFIMPNVAFEGITHVGDMKQVNIDESKLGTAVECTDDLLFANNEDSGNVTELHFAHPGAIFGPAEKTLPAAMKNLPIKPNMGHLGHLEHPDHFDALWGAQVYNPGQPLMSMRNHLTA